MTEAENDQPGLEADPPAEREPDLIPEKVPDDWLDPKPFDPAGR